LLENNENSSKEKPMFPE